MAVTARSANSLTPAASGGTDSRDLPVRAGTYAFDVTEGELTGWHSHEFHQIEYAFQGVAEVETAAARYLLPPQQAVWIPAGIEHQSTLRAVKGVSVFFDPASTGLLAVDRVRILPAAPVIREMMRYALRWPISRGTSDPMADTFFDALAYLVAEWLDRETPLSLPTPRDPLVAAAIAHTDAHLAGVSLEDVCLAVGTSERTLRRAFLADVGMTWREYLHESRLLKAMALLAGDDRNVLGVAIAVGFQSQSAFTRAFSAFAGDAPAAYRQRVRARQPDSQPVDLVVSDESAATILGTSHFQAGPPRR